MAQPAPPTISIREELCRKDGLCVRLCPVRIFATREGAVPSVAHTEECVLCGQCVAGCGSGALLHDGPDPVRTTHIEDRDPVTPEAAYAFIANWVVDAAGRLRCRDALSAAARPRSRDRHLLERAAAGRGGGRPPAGVHEARRVPRDPGGAQVLRGRDARLSRREAPQPPPARGGDHLGRCVAFDLVRKGGFEPPRPCGRQPLKLPWYAAKC